MLQFLEYLQIIYTQNLIISIFFIKVSNENKKEN